MSRALPAARAFLCPFAVVALVLACPAARGDGIIYGVGRVPGEVFYGDVEGVSPDGSVVVGHADHPDGSVQAFRWTAGDGMRLLGLLPGDTVSIATAAADDGRSIVGLSQRNNSSTAFRWTDATGMQPLVSAPFSRAIDISADGSVVVGMSGPQAWRWTAADGMQTLPAPTGTYDLSISDDGSTVVGSAKGVESVAFRWTAAGGMQTLGDFPGGSAVSRALDVSADGSVVVGTSSSSRGFEAFRWTAAGGMVGLGASTVATAVTADGSVLFGDGSAPFVWDAARGMRNLESALAADHGLDLGGWDLLSISGVSADGRTIVGNGTNPTGQREGFVIVVPEPHTAALLPAAWLALRRRRRRRSFSLSRYSGRGLG